MKSHAEIQELLNELEQNPTNADMLYKLALIDIDPFHKTQITQETSLQYLDRAAELNHPQTLYAVGMNYKFGSSKNK